jgi:hypothetical protein
MKFQIESTPFIKMIQIVAESSQPQEEGRVHVVACQGQVCVESKEIAAEMDAAVSEEGQCTVSSAQVLRALKRRRSANSLIVEAGRHGLHIGGLTLTVNSYRPYTAFPSTFQVFFASSRGLVHSDELESK